MLNDEIAAFFARAFENRCPSAFLLAKTVRTYAGQTALAAEQTNWLTANNDGVEQSPMEKSNAKWHERYDKLLPIEHWRVMQQYIPSMRTNNMQDLRRDYRIKFFGT